MIGLYFIKPHDFLQHNSEATVAFVLHFATVDGMCSAEENHFENWKYYGQVKVTVNL